MADVELSTISGADLTAFKSAMGGAGFMVPISSGSISSPVEYIDVALPIGYSSFRLAVTGLLIDYAPYDHIDFAVSADAGATFYNDLDGYETYAKLFNFNEGDWANGTGDPNCISLFDATGGLARSVSSAAIGGIVHPVTIDAVIDPGSAGRAFTCVSNFTAASLASGAHGYIQGVVATFLLEAMGRQNLFRIAPAGNQDFDAPTSGEHIVACSWSLFGIPA